MIRNASKRDLTAEDARDHIEAWQQADVDNGYDKAEYAIRWIPGSRKYGITGRWGFIVNGSEEGDFGVCTECQYTYLIIPGNVYDGMEVCQECYS